MKKVNPKPFLGRSPTAIALYKRAIASIALNDDPSELDPDIIQASLTVGTIADTFDRDPLSVATDVIAYRKEHT